MAEPIHDPQLLQHAAVLVTNETGALEHFEHLQNVITGDAEPLTKADWIAMLTHAAAVRDLAIDFLSLPSAIEIMKEVVPK